MAQGGHQRGNSLAALLDLVIGPSFDGGKSRALAVSVAEETSKYGKLSELEAELRETTTRLKVSRDKVLELQRELTAAKENNYNQHEILIGQLRGQQNKLRTDINSVKLSKRELIRKSSVEIDRLRSIIRVLQEQIECSVCGISLMNVTPAATANYMMYNSDAKLLEQIGLPNLIKLAEIPLVDDNIRPNYAADSPGGGQAVDDISGDQLAGDLQGDDDFPHGDPACIDLRTITVGDGVTYPDPFSRIEFSYTAYIHNKETGNCTYIPPWDYYKSRRPSAWEQFTSAEVRNKRYSTGLGTGSNVVGLEQAMLQMTRGETAKAWIPSRLGYGARGAGSMIPPHSDLIFVLTINEVFPEEIADDDDDGDDIVVDGGGDSDDSLGLADVDAMGMDNLDGAAFAIESVPFEDSGVGTLQDMFVSDMGADDGLAVEADGSGGGGGMFFDGFMPPDL